jgi:tetraacyldisaccharide 4'-kinase
MRNLVRDYLQFAKGEKKYSLWGVLFPLGFLTRLIVRVRTFFYDHGILPSYETDLPVISVGNITFGGTNKTPFVEMLARDLDKAGLKVGIVSRGYGGSTGTWKYCGRKGLKWYLQTMPFSTEGWEETWISF